MARIAFLLTTTPWGDQRQFYKQAPALVAGGHEVVFLADEPGQTVEDFRFVVLSKRERRMARYTGAVNLWTRIHRLRPDIVQLCSVEQLPLGLLLTVLTSIKVVYDCREDMFHGMLHSKERLPGWIRWPLALCTRGFEYLAARTFEGLIASDPAIHRIHYAMPAERRIIFYNTPLLSHFPDTYQRLAERPYDLVLLGSMGRRSGMLVLIEALQLLRQRGCRVRTLLIGQPEHREQEILERMRSEGYDISITGAIPYPKVPEVLRQSKLGLVLLLDLPKFRHNIACKVFEYMACGMPVISADLPPERLIVREGHNGVFFEPGNAAALADSVQLLLGNMSYAERLGQAGRSDFEEYWNAERDQEQLRLFYRRLLRNARRRRCTQNWMTDGESTY